MTGRLNKNKLEENKVYTSVDEFKKCSKERMVWEIPSIKDRFDEDNDTEEEQESTLAAKKVTNQAKINNITKNKITKKSKK